MSQETTQSQPAQQMQMVMRECGICQSSIFPDENVTVCSSCGLTFHAECWTENWGCAAYGCEQVNALKPKEDKPAEEEVVFQSPIQQPIERLPWNFVLLFVAAAAMIPSSFAFGVPSLLVIGIIMMRIVQTRGRQVRLGAQITLVIAMVLALIGIVGGFVVSWYWYS